MTGRWILCKVCTHFCYKLHPEHQMNVRNKHSKSWLDQYSINNYSWAAWKLYGSGSRQIASSSTASQWITIRTALYAFSLSIQETRDWCTCGVSLARLKPSRASGSGMWSRDEVSKHSRVTLKALYPERTQTLDVTFHSSRGIITRTVFKATQKHTVQPNYINVDHCFRYFVYVPIQFCPRLFVFPSHKQL